MQALIGGLEQLGAAEQRVALRAQESTIIRQRAAQRLARAGGGGGRVRWRRRALRYGVAGAAAAACLLVCLHVWRRPAEQGPIGPSVPATARTTELEQPSGFPLDGLDREIETGYATLRRELTQFRRTLRATQRHDSAQEARLALARRIARLANEVEGDGNRAGSRPPGPEAEPRPRRTNLDTKLEREETHGYLAQTDLSGRFLCTGSWRVGASVRRG
ncbi:MAG: hypothetical protein JXR37_15810 [Kiritimatiellae bacterium]|nr:hypothetical protein [Kiritimatiellia bacterium]